MAAASDCCADCGALPAWARAAHVGASPDELARPSSRPALGSAVPDWAWFRTAMMSESNIVGPATIEDRKDPAWRDREAYDRAPARAIEVGALPQWIRPTAAAPSSPAPAWARPHVGAPQTPVPAWAQARVGQLGLTSSATRDRVRELLQRISQRMSALSREISSVQPAPAWRTEWEQFFGSWRAWYAEHGQQSFLRSATLEPVLRQAHDFNLRLTHWARRFEQTAGRPAEIGAEGDVLPPRRSPEEGGDDTWIDDLFRSATGADVGEWASTVQWIAIGLVALAAAYGIASVTSVMPRAG